MNRGKELAQLLEDQPSFRSKQVMEALFRPHLRSWADVTNLPGSLKTQLEERAPFLGVTLVQLQQSEDKTTHKALLRLDDGEEIEAVLLRNARDAWTLCVSSQVGCAMKCGFCATGTLGLGRNLFSHEILDQYRFFSHYLEDHPELDGRISNIVFMGMGEPLANYVEVKKCLQLILDYTDIGKTRITVSTVGVLPRLEQILTDADWPHVRLAVSLHSADAKKRASFMPSSAPDFLPKLADWSKRYLEMHGNRRHHLTFEYVLLSGINDQEKDAHVLAKYVKSIGNVRVNLIPYNTTLSIFSKSPERDMERFKATLEDKRVTVTIRKSQGQDIAAACGQLANKSACSKEDQE